MTPPVRPGPRSLGDAFDAADPALSEALRDGLGQVESRLREVAGSSHPVLDIAAGHLVAAGGKRFRPLLTLLAGQLGVGTSTDVVEAAVVVELTHLATLYHDDVMDEAEVRRGAESANSRWTNNVAILTGDYLFARASEIIADLGPEAVRIQARTFARLVEGQISETAGPQEAEDSVEHHLRVLADKTGSLIATSAHLGALVGEAPAQQVEAVTRFGEVVGVAFQLSDDLIDVLSETGQSGKTPGTDLREGVQTLPALLALASADPAQARLRALVSRPIADDDEHTEALALLRASPAVRQARETLAASVRQARDIADELPQGPVREALHALAAYVLARTG